MNAVVDPHPERTWLQVMARTPRFWLAAQMAAIVIVGFPLKLWTAEIVADGFYYVKLSRMPLHDTLLSIRTIGYPLLLKVISIVSPDYAITPWVHFAILCGVVFLFDAAIRRFGGSPWQAFAVATGFMYAALQQRYYIAFVLTDFLGVVMAGASIACLFWIVGRPKELLGWGLLTFCLLASYQIRPVYVFMVPLTPFLGLILLRIHATRTGKPFRWGRFLLTSTAVAVIPFFAFCLARFFIVGHFGLVSFAGCTSSGMATELLDPALVQNELPEKYRPLAQAILAERDRYGRKNAFGGAMGVDMLQYRDNFSDNMFCIAMPAARRLYGNDLAVYNGELAAFSREVIRRRLGKYLLWAAYTIPYALLKIIYRYWFIWFAAPLLLLLTLLRRRLQKSSFHSNDVDGVYDDRGLLACLTWVAVLFFLASEAILACACEDGDSRFAVAAGIFIPSLMAILMLRELTLIVQKRRRHLA